MKLNILFVVSLALFFTTVATAQVRQPTSPTRPFVHRTKQQVSDLEGILKSKPGNTNEDIFAADGTQMRVALFHDEKRINDNVEIHDGSDDIYYVLDGTATLMLGGTLEQPTEISTGEWRAKTAVGGQRVTLKKGDLIIVPRGTAHQRTVTDKKFSMILIKIFREAQPVKP